MPQSYQDLLAKVKASQGPNFNDLSLRFGEICKELSDDLRGIQLEDENLFLQLLKAKFSESGYADLQFRAESPEHLFLEDQTIRHLAEVTLCERPDGDSAFRVVVAYHKNNGVIVHYAAVPKYGNLR